ncbi:DNA recombination protein RmuC [Alteromonas facilis]|uniref:DNA recombination protein RmuC n=1 Tax=Alteromonas facilis TaxID=2048004 RepID=UPI001F0C8905|nr:DNA recombination protein RmuC [Alteromonas facilis]
MLEFTQVHALVAISVAFVLFISLLVLWFRTRAANEKASWQINSLQTQIDQLSLQQDEHNRLQLHSKQLEHQVIELEQRCLSYERIEKERDQLAHQLQSAREQAAQQQAQYESRIATLVANEKASSEKLELLQQAEQRMQVQFENLANKIFEQKSESFAKANKTGLDGLLAPLKEQIEGFKKQVSDAYIKEGQERASLKTEILSLKALNQRITEEATALTNALKGDNKQQGNWGEVVLEKILEQSGLREGHEFDTQASLANEEGRQRQPDVIVHLPNEKDIIIDSKVSLVAYEAYHNTDEEQRKKEHLKQHVNSIRTHIKGLGKKDYHNLKGVKTLDYVLMFIPIEPAFLLAVDSDPEMVSFALANNIMLVSPTNLLVALRTINNIWQYEYQNQNAQAIAERAAKLYDKFSGFVSDMEKLGKSLETTSKTYDAAFNKLSSGKGNLLRQVEQFKAMGVQPSKQLPKHLLTDTEE